MTALHEKYHAAGMLLERKKKDYHKERSSWKNQSQNTRFVWSIPSENLCSNINSQISAAEMQISGHPLELVDGDSSYVPLRWFDVITCKKT